MDRMSESVFFVPGQDPTTYILLTGRCWTVSKIRLIGRKEQLIEHKRFQLLSGGLTSGIEVAFERQDSRSQRMD